MSVPLSGDEPGLAGYWPIRDGYGGDRLTDLSPAENHRRIRGAEWTTFQRVE